jgi:glycine betaine/proline transport system permease protein
LIAWRVSDWRTALLCVGCLMLMGMFDLWQRSMQTLTLILVSVGFSLLIGIPLGIMMAFNRRIEMLVQPVLDGMQTLPTFVYLIPVILFFGIADVPSLVATVIYAVPPAARLTALGLKQVPEETLEAARAFGSTRWQTLYKVQFPMALPSIMAGVNQTIMMALSMVVIAALIGAGGLGREVSFALRRLRVGDAFEAGLAIVAMAILLDRLTEGWGQAKVKKQRVFRLLPDMLARFNWARRFEGWLERTFRWKIQRSLSPRWGKNGYRSSPVRGWLWIKAHLVGRRYGYWAASLLLLWGLTQLLTAQGVTGYPENWHWSIRDEVDSAVEWAQINLYEIEGTAIGTGPLSDFVSVELLMPLRNILQTHLPWSILVLLVASLAWGISDLRLAVLAGLGLLSIGLLGMWSEAMDTLSQVMIAVVVSVIIGIPLGVLSARFRTLERLLRPVLDTLQTIPSFVYLVPMIMLFNLGRVPGVLASILYALPPVIRLTSLGIQQVDKTVLEAAQSFGSSPWQVLYKVQLPLALPTIMLGINQTIMMVLAMVVVAGLVGGGGLGFEVVSALAEKELGRGLEAGLAIMAMAMVLDRITQAWSLRRAQVTA